jgi:hypothetical protein
MASLVRVVGEMAMLADSGGTLISAVPTEMKDTMKAKNRRRAASRTIQAAGWFMFSECLSATCARNIL